MASGGHSCEPWNEDDPADLPLIQRRLRDLLLRLAGEATPRAAPTVAMARGWHREIHQGLNLPVPYYAGEVRNADPGFPCLFGYEVQVGPFAAVPSADVPVQLRLFERAIQEATVILDDALPIGRPPAKTDELLDVLALCAAAHGEWVRIHPFANGNGRTARLWANWCALRYGLPPFVRLRPRPAGLDYERAAAASMMGNHERMEDVFLDMLLHPP